MIFKLFLIVLQDLFQGYTYSLLNSTLLCMHEKNLWIHSLINFSFSIALSVSFIISTKMSGAWNLHGVCSHTTIGRRADLGSVCCHKHKRNLIWNHPRVPVQTRALSGCDTSISRLFRHRLTRKAFVLEKNLLIHVFHCNTTPAYSGFFSWFQQVAILEKPVRPDSRHQVFMVLSQCSVTLPLSLTL